MQLLLRLALVGSALGGHPCWEGGGYSEGGQYFSGYSYQKCCFCPGGDPGCFDGKGFTFEVCCDFAYASSKAAAAAATKGDALQFRAVPFLPCSELPAGDEVRGVLVELPSSRPGIKDLLLRMHQREPSALLLQSGYTMARWILDGAGGVADGVAVLDTASGSGITALVGAYLGAKVMTTDIDEQAMEFAATNIKENAQLLRGSITSRRMAWGEDPGPGFRVAVCGGCWGPLDDNPELAEPLLQTLQAAGVETLLIGGWQTRGMATRLAAVAEALGTVEVALSGAQTEELGYAPVGMQQTLYRIRVKAASVEVGAEAPAQARTDASAAEWKLDLTDEFVCDHVNSVFHYPLLQAQLETVCGADRFDTWDDDDELASAPTSPTSARAKPSAPALSCDPESGVRIQNELLRMLYFTLPPDCGNVPKEALAARIREAAPHCPSSARAFWLLALLGRRYEDLPRSQKQLVEDVLNDWVLSFAAYHWSDQFPKPPRALLLHTFLAASSAYAEPPSAAEDARAAAEPSEVALELQHLFDSHLRLEPNRWNATALGCSLTTATLMVAQVDAQKGTFVERLTDAFALGGHTVLRGAGRCVRTLAASHGLSSLLRERTRALRLLLGWHHQMSSLSAPFLYPPKLWTPELDVRRQPPRMSLLLDRDFESKHVRGAYSPFCNAKAQAIFQAAARKGANGLVDVGAYLGGCSVYALTALESWQVLSIDPYGPAQRAMASSRHLNRWGRRWRVSGACVGPGGGRLRLRPFPSRHILGSDDIRFDYLVGDGNDEAKRELISAPKLPYPWCHPSDFEPIGCKTLDVILAEDAPRQEAAVPFVLRVHTHFHALGVLQSASKAFEAGHVAAVVVEVYDKNVVAVVNFLKERGCIAEERALVPPIMAAGDKSEEAIIQPDWTVTATCGT
eukprot:TRINITY_DN18158_c0_g1_i2.p1 TRINITY_DN18158_c0_g1~~TRINITY_DN18158_c0_g1_i2.p1  ORF type:complete len:911 (+),score=212.95 TRINITY_DN18158_c0_g1_i2:173-2905(+)